MSDRIERTAIRFGTDGWRAVIAREFTFTNLERVAQAYADYLIQQSADSTATDKPRGRQLVIVGYDRRFLSEAFARRVAEVVAGNNLEVVLFGTDVPTPVVSWAVRQCAAVGGVMITASHNPPEFNGFKIKAAWGGSAPQETTRAVESLVDANAPQRGEISDGNAQLLSDAVASYKAQIANFIDLERLGRSNGLVIIDPMHGAGGRWVESFLQGGNLKAETIRAERDPLFGGVNPEPIDQNLEPLKERVRETGALVGLATDGDADRVGAVNELGHAMTMHEVVPLILLHLARNRKMTGGVVRTFSQSVLTKRIAEAHDLPLYDTPIGFKYVADLMLREDILLGAEESGGIGVKNHIPERDGILNSLLLLEAIILSGKSPSEMVREMHREFGEFYFGRRDLQTEVAQGLSLVNNLAASPPANFAGYAVQGVSTTDGTKLIFDDESWLLFRQSGTEPMLRIYSEATSTEKMQRLLDGGCAIAQNHAK